MNNNIDAPNFQSHLAIFCEKLRNKLTQYKDRLNLTYFTNYEIQTSFGQRYAKIFKTEMKDGKQVNLSIVAFVDINNGDVLKPMTYSAPAKIARGNIYSSSFGMEAIDEGGFVKYLK